MSPTHINNVAVVSVEPARSNLTNKVGTEIVFKKASRLTLVDGQVWHGCTYPGCDFVTPKAAQSIVVWHYPREHGGNVPVKNSRKLAQQSKEPSVPDCAPAEIMGMTLAEILEKLTGDLEWAEMVEKLRTVNTSLRGELAYARRENDRLRTDY